MGVLRFFCHEGFIRGSSYIRVHGFGVHGLDPCVGLAVGGVRLEALGQYSTELTKGCYKYMGLKY